MREFRILLVTFLLLFVATLSGSATAQTCDPKHPFVTKRVVDGDTLEVLVSIGYDTYREISVRLYGIDTPEKYGVKKWADAEKTTYTPEYAAGQAATDYTADWLAKNCVPRECLISSHGTGKYGRWLVLVYSHEGAVLNDDLVTSGNAVRKDY